MNTLKTRLVFQKEWEDVQNVVLPKGVLLQSGTERTNVTTITYFCQSVPI